MPHELRGCNSRQSRVWREDDAPLRRMITEYALRDDSDDPRARERDRVAQRDACARQVLAALPTVRRPLARLVLRLAARGIPLRGIGKASFLQAIDIGRVAARRAGDLLTRQHILADPDDVFYLTMDELARAGSAAAAAFADVVEHRKQRRAEYSRLALPSDWRGMPEPVALGGQEHRASAGGIIEGVGVSKGCVDGVARVVLDPDFMDVEPGEILVAPITDPSWSSIMFISKALVVDLGGALSHAAIVARELSIPCVVNTRNGTAALRTGDLIRVNGDQGTVEVLSIAEAPAS
jgi:pyruvate,water dikinase